MASDAINTADEAAKDAARLANAVMCACPTHGPTTALGLCFGCMVKVFDAALRAAWQAGYEADGGTDECRIHAMDVTAAHKAIKKLRGQCTDDLHDALAKLLSAEREPLEQRIRELESSRSVAVDLAALSGFEAGKADAEIRIRELEQENERLRAQKVRVDEWGLKMLEPLGDFLRKSLAADHPMTTHIEASFPDMPDAGRVPVLHLWATTSETEPAARCRELAMAREHAIEQREALRARLSAAEQLLLETAREFEDVSHDASYDIDARSMAEAMAARLRTFLAPADQGKP